MAEPRDAAPSRRRSGDDGDQPTSGIAAGLASAGRWVGERGEGRRWEDLLSEFMAAILTWAAIGWLVDRWLDTDPWFLIAGVLLGNGLGLYLMWLRSDPDRVTTRRAAAATGDHDGGDDAGGRPPHAGERR